MEKVKKKTRGDISFESALKELETIANRLEDGSLSLINRSRSLSTVSSYPVSVIISSKRQNAGSRFSRKEILPNH